VSGLRRRVPEPIRLLLANPKSRFGIVLLLVIVVAVIAAPLLTSHLPTEPDSLPRQPPSWEYPFGTTDQGYNVFAQVLYGGRVSLGVAAVASLIAMSIAITLGLLAAYSGGWVDDVIVLLQGETSPRRFEDLERAVHAHRASIEAGIRSLP